MNGANRLEAVSAKGEPLGIRWVCSDCGRHGKLHPTEREVIAAWLDHQRYCPGRRGDLEAELRF